MALGPLAPTPQFVTMCTPLEPKSLVSIGAVPRPPDVATSVLVTYMSAQEQSRMLEAIAMKDFIYVRLAIRRLSGENAIGCGLLMQLSCRSQWKNTRRAGVSS